MNIFSPHKSCNIILLISFIMISNQSIAQDSNKVRISPKAAVVQTVGFTDVRIDYSRPGVKGRMIWDGLVPYNKVWRAGANEATKITFANDVKINSKTLKAGSYSFFTIPTKDKWTLIFNYVAHQWGAFEYNESEDALRIEVTPEEGNMQEWLAYTIIKTSDNSAVVKLEWEKLNVSFIIDVTTK
ncbi:MAG: DUF2911 domain-containing protein [Ignavibacteria bacterium]|nr:MAG: DUF2911 domain-containing protein [Ignavibacteria bacterium]